MRARLRTVAGVTLALGLASPVAAQLTSSLDVGAASVTYRNGYRLGVVSLTPALRLERVNASVLATGTLSRLETGMLSSSGGLDAYVMTGVRSGLRAELGASGGGSANDCGGESASHAAMRTLPPARPITSPPRARFLDF